MKSQQEKTEKFSIKDIEPLIDSIIKENNTLTEELICLNLEYNGGYISQLRSREKTTGEPQVSQKFYNQLKNFSLQNANAKTIPDSISHVSEPETGYELKGIWGSGQDKFINALLEEKDRAIKKAEEFAQKMENHYEDAKIEKAKMLDIINNTLKEISSNLKETATSLAHNRQDLALLKDQTYIVSSQLEHQREALNLGFPGEKKTQPVPFVKKGKAGSGVQHDGGKKNKDRS